MDLFIEDALVTVEQTVYDGKDRIRYWIEKDIPFLTAARECSEWSDVNEATDRLDFYESCNFEEAPQQRHHTLFFENGKIRSWTMTLQHTE